MQGTKPCTKQASGSIKKAIHQLQRAELHAIDRHKYFMSQERGEDVGFETASEDWKKHHALKWREMRQKKMNLMQHEEIQRYKWYKSEMANRDVGSSVALEWVQLFADKWRAWFENEYFDE